MFEKGNKLVHVKSPNFINEMVDSFSITAIHGGHGPKIMITAGRESVDIKNETFIENEKGITTEVGEGDSVMTRFTVANLAVPLESARSFAKTLQYTIDAYDAQIAQLLEEQGK